jgi:hypothetical protein
MSFKSYIVTFPLLWVSVTAAPRPAPAGPGYFPPGEPYVPGINGSEMHAKAYGLIESYDTSNWLSKFDVQAVSYISETVLSMFMCLLSQIPDPTRMCCQSESCYASWSSHTRRWLCQLCQPRGRPTAWINTE